MDGTQFFGEDGEETTRKSPHYSFGMAWLSVYNYTEMVIRLVTCKAGAGVHEIRKARRDLAFS
ncbi:hypothetical protein SAMN05660236_5931 [Ohtaekwangia koreensis]|uniref:Uncharacterized protein n=2 Tax=Ohtaekwangia koreensis TaxID=688867 RepID=A0A1T5MP46_9BACT|nr:hypothetical protein SAMN05660236_5931 [Ohtaekwangia koreensis]